MSVAGVVPARFRAVGGLLVGVGRLGWSESTTNTFAAWARVAVPNGLMDFVPSWLSKPERTPVAAVHVRASSAQESALSQSVVNSSGTGSGSVVSMPAHSA